MSEEKKKPKVFWYVDLSSFEVEAPNGYAARIVAKEKIASPDFEVEIADYALAKIVCCEEEMEEVYEEQKGTLSVHPVKTFTGHRCTKCGTFIPRGSVETYNMDREKCCECGASVAPGSGNFVNRVPSMNGFAERVANGHPFPCGGYICARDDAHPNDETRCCEKLVGISGIEKIIDVCARCEEK